MSKERGLSMQMKNRSDLLKNDRWLCLRADNRDEIVKVRNLSGKKRGIMLRKNGILLSNDAHGRLSVFLV